MEEKKIQIAWYRFRGLGLICLCSLVFFAGTYVTGQKSVPVNGRAKAVAEIGTETALLPVCSVETEEKKAALTFDADRSNEQTEAILNILDKYGVKATFFVSGAWADQYPEDVKRIAAAGHDLGNHSQSHQDMTAMTRRAIQTEIQTLHEKVFALTGEEMKLFRAPYGVYSEELLATVEMSGYMPIQWDIDTQDWKNYGVESVVRTVTGTTVVETLGAETGTTVEAALRAETGTTVEAALRDETGTIVAGDAGAVKNGSIILLHNEADYITQILEPLIKSLQERGYELVPVSQIIRWSDYTIDANGRQIASKNTEDSEQAGIGKASEYFR